MAFTLNIADVDYTSTLENRSLSISEALQANGQKMSLTLYLKNNPELFVPVAGQVIEFLHEGAVEFRGRISVVYEEWKGSPDAIRYKIDCIDFTADLDTKLLVTNIAEDYAGNQIASIVGQIGRGFTINNVVLGPEMAALQLDYEYPSSAISKIAETIEHQWYVDYDRDINFFYIRDRPAPVDNIDLDSDIRSYFDFSFEENVEQVKNAIYLTGAKAKSGNQATQQFTADGNTRFFPLMYPPHHGEDPSELTFRVAPAADPTNFGPAYTVKLDGVDSQAGDGNTDAMTAFVCYDNWGVRLGDGLDSGDPGSGIPQNGDQVQVGYNYDYDPVVYVEDPVSIAMMRDREYTDFAPSDGYHEYKFDIPDLRVTTEDAIIEYGNLLLARYAYPIKTATFSSLLQGWTVGQSLTLTSERHRLESERFYIHGVSKAIRYINEEGDALVYEITCSNTPFPG